MNQPGIYAIIHVLSGTRYIGQTNSLERRWSEHQKQLLDGTHHNLRIQRVWFADGPDAFDFKVLQYAPVQLDGKALQKWLAERESYFIATHKSTGQAFNIIDAELVETRASRQDMGAINPNVEITQGLTELKSLISGSEKNIRMLEQLVRQRTEVVLANEKTFAPKLFGLLASFNRAEAERLAAGRVPIMLANEQLKDAERQLAGEISSLDSLVARRKSLIQSYAGNQKRQASRRRLRSMF